VPVLQNGGGGAAATPPGPGGSPQAPELLLEDDEDLDGETGGGLADCGVRWLACALVGWLV
jgi:hypothetical protein